MYAVTPPSYIYPMYQHYPAFPLARFPGYPPVFSPFHHALVNPSQTFLPVVHRLPQPPPTDIPLDLTMKKGEKSAIPVSPFTAKEYCSETKSSPREFSANIIKAEINERKPLSISNHKMTKGKPSCKICNKTFTTAANLRVHVRLHTGEKPYECPHCNKRFTQNPSLRAHLRIHTGEKPFSCAVCSRAFADYSTWQKHRRLHSGEKPYVCEICGKGFAQSGNLIRHRRSIHGSTKRTDRL